MPARFDRYRMQDGVTPLSERYFNPVLQDIDTRLADIEAKKISFDEAVKTLTDFGLLRINEVLAPSMEQLAAAMATVDARRAALDASIDQAMATLGEIVTRAHLDQVMADQQAAVDAAVTSAAESVDARVSTLESLVYAAL